MTLCYVPSFSKKTCMICTWNTTYYIHNRHDLKIPIEMKETNVRTTVQHIAQARGANGNSITLRGFCGTQELKIIEPCQRKGRHTCFSICYMSVLLKAPSAKKGARQIWFQICLLFTNKLFFLSENQVK